jgi:saccharopine dehydrogenase-like NADP-dependent oxidoreductase
MTNVLLIGAGGVAHVAAHKCAQNNDILGDICIASRTLQKCDKIVDSILEKGSLKVKSGRLYTRALNALDVGATVALIKETKSSIVINLGSPFVNMSVLEACIKTGVHYLDTAIHEEPDRVATICEPPPWYGNYEWKRKDRCSREEINAILGIGFDPGVVNAYAALAARKLFDTIDTIEIIDINDGCHGRYFSTNFDPEINFREFMGTVWQWINRKWTRKDTHKEKMVCTLPVVGKQTVYMTGHDELHSLSKNIDANTITFWMGFSDHYLNVFSVLKNLGLLSEKPVTTAEGIEVVPLKVVKACLPDPMSLAPTYKGKTCIGNYTTGKKDGVDRSVFIYNVCDHADCYKEVGSQAISYTAGVPVVAAAILVAKKIWNPETMVNVEELDPEPLIALMDTMGLPTQIEYDLKVH